MIIIKETDQIKDFENEIFSRLKGIHNIVPGNPLKKSFIETKETSQSNS